MTPTTVHIIDRILSDPAVLGAFLAVGACNCVMMLCERMQTIRINALAIEQLRTAIDRPPTNDTEVPAIWVSYSSRARYYRRGNK